MITIATFIPIALVSLWGVGMIFIMKKNILLDSIEKKCIHVDKPDFHSWSNLHAHFIILPPSA